MKRLLKTLLTLVVSLWLSVAWAADYGDDIFISISGDYCSSQSWNTLTGFRLDFAHTTDSKTACLSSGTEAGVLTNATVTTPTTASPGSGGGALLIDGDNHYITFDNDTPYFTSQYGEMYLMVQLVGDNTSWDQIMMVEGVASQDLLKVMLASGGNITAYWEDNNGGEVNSGNAIDLDNYYGDWAQIHIKWDTTRCTDGADTCDGAGEDELCIRARVDDNRDGDFDDGGAENWTSWVCETSAKDFEVWSIEPGSGDIDIGLVGTTHSQNIYIDDVEISTSQPSW